VNGQIATVNTIACTGTLIAPDVVLAAGHCVDHSVYDYDLQQQGLTLNGIEFFISFKGDLTSMASGMNAPMPDDAVRVTGYDIHPQYSLEYTGTGPQHSNDISVLYLASAQTVKPALVITQDEALQVAQQSEVEIVGWGQTTAAAQPAPGTVGEKECATTFVNQLGSWEMQIGSGVTSARKCHGDSGGPTFMNVETSFATKRRVIGVTSHAYDQTDCQRGGVDTRVDPYLDWLDQTLSGRCAAGVRAWCEVPGLVSPSYYEPPAPPAPTDGGSSAGTARRSRCSSAAISWVALLGLALLRRRSSSRAVA
jgi:hypothetical protein